MKTKIIAILLLSAASLRAQHTVNLEWDKNPEPDVAGYRVYERAGETWKLLGTTPADTVKFSAKNLPAGTHTFAVTAFNAEMESERGNEVTASLLAAPAGLRVVTVVVKP